MKITVWYMKFAVKYIHYSVSSFTAKMHIFLYVYFYVIKSLTIRTSRP